MDVGKRIEELEELISIYNMTSVVVHHYAECLSRTAELLRMVQNFIMKYGKEPSEALQ